MASRSSMILKQILAGILVAFLVAGCAGLGRQIEPPQVSLMAIALEKMTVFESIYDVKLRILNTNDLELNTRGIDFVLELNGKRFATGVSDAKITIPALGTAVMPLKVYSNLIDMFKSLQTLPEREQIAYHLKGKIHLSGDTTAGPIPFDSEGKVDLSRPSQPNTVPFHNQERPSPQKQP